MQNLPLIFVNKLKQHIFLVFYHLCYEGAIDLDAITDLNQRHALEVQIMEFGQIPKQVFKVPHPQRKIGYSIQTEPYQIKEIQTNCEGK